MFGCGYVGLTTAAGLAEIGHSVLGVDNNSNRIAMLKKGKVPFFEPGLSELLQHNIKEKRISFITDAKAGIEFGEIVLCAVGTPPLKDHRADLSAVLDVAAAFGKYGSAAGANAAHGGASRNGTKIFINKSTVPVGTSEEIAKIIKKNAKGGFNFQVVSNPEFLREGSAISDFFNPDRIVCGMQEDSKSLPKAPRLAGLRKIITQLYKPMIDNGVPMLFTDIRSAEIIKYASNAYLATRISFINELANFAETAGADIKKVAYGMGLDKRIGTGFLEAGIGFGGSCLPKDLKALIEIGKAHKFDFNLLKSVQEINAAQSKIPVKKLRAVLKNLRGKTVAIWGLSFKPRTDDTRDAPSLAVISELLKNGVKIRAFDPAVKLAPLSGGPLARVSRELPGKITMCGSAADAVKNADALIICTEWDEFRCPDYKKIRRLMKQHIIIDGRNILEPEEARENGFQYFGIGRSSAIYETTLSRQRKLKSPRS